MPSTGVSLEPQEFVLTGVGALDTQSARTCDLPGSASPAPHSSGHEFGALYLLAGAEYNYSRCGEFTIHK